MNLNKPPSTPNTKLSCHNGELPWEIAQLDASTKLLIAAKIIEDAAYSIAGRADGCVVSQLILHAAELQRTVNTHFSDENVA